MRSRAVLALALAALAHAALLVVPVHFSAFAQPDELFVALRLPAIEPPPEPEPPEPEPPPEDPPPPPEPPPPRPPPEPEPLQPRAPPDPPPEADPQPPPAQPARPVEARPVAPIDPAQVAQAEVPAQVVPEQRPAQRPPGPPVRRPSKADLRSYAQQMRAAFLRHRRYPPAALRLRLEGVVKVGVSVDRQGNLVGSPRLIRSSGHSVLDEEALRVVRVAAPFAPLPPHAEKAVMVFVIPIDFRVERS